MRNFLVDAGLILKPNTVEALLSAHPMRGGREHRVAYLPDAGRVLKVADAHALATETLYDYLTDLLLSNYYFDDDLQLLGAYEMGDRLQVVISQPYVNGRHPEWAELKAGLVKQGLRDPHPGALGGNFIIDDDLVGEIHLFDLHMNNVICDSTGKMNPIDAHFYFDSPEARDIVLTALGLECIIGPTRLGAEVLSAES